MSTKTAPEKESDAQAYKDEDTLRRLYWDEGLPAPDIADRLGCSKSTVYRWMRKYDIEIMDKNEAVSKHHRKEYADYRMKEDGHYRWLAVYNGTNEYVYVARLLAVAEYGFDAVCDKVVHHKNQIPWDDRPSNIELMDSGEHTKHHTQGEDHANSKLTEDEVRQIVNLYENANMTQKEIADRYDVCHQAVSNIMRGLVWTHVTGYD